MTTRLQHLMWVIVVSVMTLLCCIAGAIQTYTKPALLLEDTTLAAVTAVNGYPIADAASIEQILDRYTPGTVVHISFGPPGNSTSRRVVLSRYYSSFYLVLQMLSGFVFFFLGLYTILHCSHDISARVFFLLVLSVAVLIMTTWGNYTILPWGSGHIIRAVFAVSHCAMGIFFVWFAVFFPTSKIAQFRVFLWVYTLVVSATALWGAATSLYVTLSGTLLNSTYLIALNCCRGCAVVGCILAYSIMLYSHRQAREESERRQLRWTLFGSTISAGAYTLLWQVPQLIIGRELIREDFLLLTSIAAPLTFSIAIIRYRAFDINVLIRRSTVYSVVILILLGVYAVVQALVFRIISPVSNAWLLTASGIVLVFDLLLFMPVHGIVRRFVDRLFFRTYYNYRQEQRSIINELLFSPDATDVVRILSNYSDKLFSPKYLACHIYNNFTSSTTDIHYSYLPVEIPSGRATYVEGDADVIFLPTPIDPEYPIALCFPLMPQDGTSFGRLLLGPKKSGSRYSVEDVDLLRAITTQASLVLERIALSVALVHGREEASRLEEIANMKSYFVTLVSHELKTPLASIRMFAEMMLFSRSQASFDLLREKEYLEIIEGESQRLARLIDNVLDYARIEHGVKIYSLMPVDIREVLDEAARIMQYLIEMHNCILRTSIEVGNVFVLADRSALVDTVLNLLSNALKYSRPGGVIGLNMKLCDRTVCIEICDNGIGIAAEDIARIFDPFFRSSSSEAQRREGTGLGLTIVQHCVEAHQGALEVESTLGKGSIFRIIIPILIDTSIGEVM